MAYKQCKVKNGNQRLFGWIPEKGAFVGATFEIKGLDGDWTVYEVCDYSVSDNELTDIKKFSRNTLPSLITKN